MTKFYKKLEDFIKNQKENDTSNNYNAIQRISNSKFTNEFNDYNAANLSDLFTRKINNDFETAMTEALKIKGFTFDTLPDLKLFLINEVQCIDFSEIRQKIYYVNGVAFLGQDYNFRFQEVNEFTMSAKIYKYTFL